MNDEHIRQQALSPEKSFIVQAPAGSGKTELLTQRFLKLLTRVNMPEEIIAITFTRKAAAEMRERILLALTLANQTLPPDESHQVLTWQLAKKVLKQDQKNNWQLQNNPNRLRILTIDALAATLCAQIPLSAGFGAQPTIIEEPYPYYQQAVYELLDSENNLSEIETLLLHLDNNIEQVESLLINILACREQWLPHIMTHYNDTHFLKKQLEKSLANIVIENVTIAKKTLNDDYADELISLAQFAGNNLKVHNPSHAISACAGLTQYPSALLSDFSIWLGLANLLLTQTGEWRKIVDKRSGFPTIKKSQDPQRAEYYRHYKKQMMDFLAAIKNEDSDDALKIALQNIQLSPPTHYNSQQWIIIQTLIKLLPILVARLKIIFMEHGVIDFIELNLGALRALGDHTQPTDLALYLDYQIQHLLIDEFQDTSITQFRLIEQLLSGWQADDGRTLFLVGDPMQSIYYFRDAEVGLFLRAQQQGIANITLQALTLKCNFRSNANIVTWVNATFSKIFPKHSDITIGAVPYTSATAAKNNKQRTGVYYYPLLNANDNDESQQILEIIKIIQTKQPKHTIAIMIRSRYQLDSIIPALQAAKIPFQAIDIETLSHHMAIQDLVTLTRALFHLGDRIAWLSLLRAPWCGLKLSDLHAIAQHCKINPIWSSLIHFHEIKNLSNDAMIRLKRVVPILANGLNQKGQYPLALWLQNTWVTLGGPACLNYSTEIENTNTYFKLIEEIECQFSFELLENKLQQLYAKSLSPDGENLQIMTIHKTKGLEFDHVILPGLNRKAAVDKEQLLRWLERPSLSGENDLILAPIKASNEYSDPIYDYLKTIEKNRLEHETARLLYVAVTRAKNSCHLISPVEFVEEEHQHLKAPNKGSLLNLLWPVYKNEFTTKIKKIQPEEKTPMAKTHPQLTRLKQTWQLPFTIGFDTKINETFPRSLKLASLQRFQQYLGIIVHEALENVVNDGVDCWDKNKIQSMKKHWKYRLQQLGVLPSHSRTYVDLVSQAIINTLNDKMGQWILSNQHEASKNEYALTTISHGKTQHLIIDRTFISEGVRWIIDYKTAIPSHQPLDIFLQEQEEQYQSKLHQYAHALERLDNRPVKAGLYFPLCAQWHECKLLTFEAT